MKSREFLRFALTNRVSHDKTALPIFNPAKFLLASSRERNLLISHEKMHSNDEKQETYEKSHWPFFVPGMAGRAFLAGVLVAKSVYASEDQIEAVDAEKIINMVIDGDLGSLKKYVTKENYSAIKDKKGNTLLLIAAKAGHLETVQWLLMEEIAAINERNNKGRTALLKACQHGHKDLAIWLLEKAGANLDDRTEGNQSVLTEAVNGGSIPLVEYLRSRGLDMAQEVSDLYSPLLTAAYNGDVAMVQYLVNKCGLDISVQYSSGGTALLFAAFGSNKDISYEPLIQFLIDNGLDIHTRDKHGCTPLLHAVTGARLSLVRFFVSRGLNINDRDNSGLTALHIAVLINDFELVKFLLESGAEVDAKDSRGKTPSNIIDDHLYDTYKEMFHLPVRYPVDFRKIETEHVLYKEDIDVWRNRDNIRRELSNFLQRKSKEREKDFVKREEDFFRRMHKNEDDKEKDIRSVVETFRKNLSEKLNIQLYTDKAICEGMVRTLPGTLDQFLEIAQAVSAMSGDMSLRIAANLAKIYAQGKLEESRVKEASYIKIFKKKLISEITREAAKLVGERYREQLWMLSAEGLDDFSQYFCDKLILGLKAKYGNGLSKAILDMLENTGVVGERRAIPLVREMIDIMVDPAKGKSVSLELRGKENKETNRDKKENWDSRELMSNVGIVVMRKYIEMEVKVEYLEVSQDFTKQVENWKKNGKRGNVLFIYEPVEQQWKAYVVINEGKEWEEKSRDFPYVFMEELKSITLRNISSEVVENLQKLLRKHKFFDDDSLGLNKLYILKPRDKKYGVCHGDKNDVLAYKFSACAFLGMFGCKPRRLSELERYDYESEFQAERKVSAAA